jgi:hypothetical protein
MKTDNIKTTVITPGRAMLIELEWHREDPLSILGVYAPNPTDENAKFWDDIREWFMQHPGVRKPDGMGGDTNIVEDPIDRMPARPDPDIAVTAFDKLKSYLGFTDGWRSTYPTTKAFTYLQKATGSQSRIDRILVKHGLMDQAYEWEIQTVGVKTDHKMVSVRLTTANAPTTGPGRWVLPKHVMKDKYLSEFVQTRGLELQSRLREVVRLPVRDPQYNPQTLWACFKREFIIQARRRAKIAVPRANKEIRDFELRLEKVLGDPNIPPEDKELSAAVLTEKLAKLHVARHSKARMSAQIRNRLEGEIISKYWSMLNRVKKPKDVIHRLKKPPDRNTAVGTQPVYETNSKNMANIARNYHNKIQKDREDILPDVREPIIEMVLGRMARKATLEQIEDLQKKLTRDNVIESLKLSANDKAPGDDGIQYEIWKIIDSRYHTFAQQDKQAFDIVSALHAVYNDIETYGVVAGTGFAKSWMAPVHKKNDRADIANYRPISLLNTDYKIFTKALTIKLAKVAPDLIHPAQAGFVPGRHIYDQIWLTKRIIDLAEATEMQGAIVALDQEKA